MFTVEHGSFIKLLFGLIDLAGFLYTACVDIRVYIYILYHDISIYCEPITVNQIQNLELESMFLWFPCANASASLHRWGGCGEQSAPGIGTSLVTLKSSPADPGLYRPKHPANVTSKALEY